MNTIRDSERSCFQTPMPPEKPLSLKPPPPREAACIAGCPNKRQPWEVCCRAHWQPVPRAMKVELWRAQEAASKGRGKRKNGQPTARWQAAYRACVAWLIGQMLEDPRFATLGAEPVPRPADPPVSEQVAP